MGDRILFEIYPDDSTDPPIYIYSHWGRTSGLADLAKALKAFRATHREDFDGFAVLLLRYLHIDSDVDAVTDFVIAPYPICPDGLLVEVTSRDVIIWKTFNGKHEYCRVIMSHADFIKVFENYEVHSSDDIPNLQKEVTE